MGGEILTEQTKNNRVSDNKDIGGQAPKTSTSRVYIEEREGPEITIEVPAVVPGIPVIVPR